MPLKTSLPAVILNLLGPENTGVCFSQHCARGWTESSLQLWLVRGKWTLKLLLKVFSFGAARVSWRSVMFKKRQKSPLENQRLTPKQSKWIIALRVKRGEYVCTQKPKLLRGTAERPLSASSLSPSARKKRASCLTL